MNSCGFFSTSVVSNTEFWCLGVPFAVGMEEIKRTGEGGTGLSLLKREAPGTRELYLSKCLQIHAASAQKFGKTQQHKPKTRTIFSPPFDKV